MKNFLLGVMSTVLCIVVLGANYQPQAVKKYEYANQKRHDVRHKILNMGDDPEKLEELEKRELIFINKQAAKGWRLFQVEYHTPGGGHLWFEREIRQHKP